MNLKQRIITAIVLLAMLASTIMSAANATNKEPYIEFIVSTSSAAESTKEIFIKPSLKNIDSSKGFKNVHDFLSYTSANGYVAGIEFIKSIFLTAVNKGLTDGFVFKETKDSNGELMFGLMQNTTKTLEENDMANCLGAIIADDDPITKKMTIIRYNFEILPDGSVNQQNKPILIDKFIITPYRETLKRTFPNDELADDSEEQSNKKQRLENENIQP